MAPVLTSRCVISSRAHQRQGGVRKKTNQLHDLLEQLASEDKSLVNMLMEGWSLDGVAKRLSISYTNAAVRIHRLREKLLNGLKAKRL